LANPDGGVRPLQSRNPAFSGHGCAPGGSSESTVTNACPAAARSDSGFLPAEVSSKERVSIRRAYDHAVAAAPGGGPSSRASERLDRSADRSRPCLPDWMFSRAWETSVAIVPVRALPRAGHAEFGGVLEPEKNAIAAMSTTPTKPSATTRIRCRPAEPQGWTGRWRCRAPGGVAPVGGADAGGAATAVVAEGPRAVGRSGIGAVRAAGAGPLGVPVTRGAAGAGGRSSRPSGGHVSGAAGAGGRSSRPGGGHVSDAGSSQV
jgi:hypothetical protein